MFNEEGLEYVEYLMTGIVLWLFVEEMFDGLLKYEADILHG